MNFPNDADGDALRRLIHDGSDLSRPMAIDFTVDVPTRAAGEAVARAAEQAGYQTSVEMDEEDGAWTCYCTRYMIANYAAVVEAQRELNRLSEPHGGSCDGWGSFGNAAGAGTGS
jgi:regulator of RNase E activity RraB